MSAPGPHGQLLIIDDGERPEAPVAAILRNAGFQVRTASSTKQAVELFNDQMFDLVLLRQRRSGAADALKQLRQQFSGAELPILVEVAGESRGDAAEFIQLGASDCLIADEPPEVLRARVATHVQLKRTTDELQATHTALARLQRKLDNDLQAAARIQQSQMPPDDLQIDGWEVAWQSHPCETLGGDSLNVFRLDDENWALYVLDVSGHGVPASLLAVSVSRILTPGRDGSGRHDTLLPPRPLGDGRGSRESPSAASAVYVLERLQEKFVPDEDAVQYFTIMYVTLNTRTGEVRIASGGHPSPILMRAGQRPTLLRDPDGPAIGLIPIWADIHFQEADLRLEPGDTLLMYSDGVIESFDRQQRLYGIDRLQRSLQTYADQPLRRVIPCIHAEIEAWRDGLPQKDDETMLAIRRLV